MTLPTLETIRARRSPAIRSACHAGQARLRRAWRQAWRHRERMKPSAWIRERMRLDNTVEAGSGRYDVDRRPWWIPILDAFDDPEVASVAIAAATQIGKTLSIIALILWAAENAPAPAMLVTPDKDTAIELRDRIYLNAAATIRSGGCKHLRIPPEHDWNTRYIDLGSMRVYLAWSGSRQRLRGRPCRYVFLTEVAVYAKGMKKAGDPVSAAHQRIKAFFRGFLYQESSPSEHPCRMTELEQQATWRSRWHVRCPHCGRVQELRFFLHKSGELAGKGGIAGIQDAGGEYVSQETARLEAYYVCEAGCRIDNHDKQALLESGRHVPYGCRVGKPPKCRLTGSVPKSRRKLGFHLWSVHSEQITFGDLAASYVEAREQLKLPEWWGNWLGLEYKPESRVPEWAQLGRKNAWSNCRWQVPREAWFLTAAVDVQAENNGCRVTVRGWAPGRTSWLVGWQWIERDLADANQLIRSDLAAVSRDILERRFSVVDAEGRPAVNPLGRRELAVKLLAIDVGHDPRGVHAWLKTLPESWVLGETPRVRAVRGDHQLTPETRWQVTEWEQNVRTGEKYEGGLTVWRLYVYPFYETLTQLLCAEPGQPGGWHVTADALTLGKAYLEQVVNFGRSVKFDEKSGAKKAVWGPRNHRVPIDFWDCEIYDLVAAEMVVGDLGWDAGKWEQWRERVRGQAAARKEQERNPRRSREPDNAFGGLDDR
jgi:phage terminase large subunit GpA-like protein